MSQRTDFEIVLVDDYSKDGSREVCKKLSRKYQFVKTICLNRNFGQHNARMAGLHFVTGDYIIFMDDDLQNPPESICRLIEEIQKGYDVVYSFSEKKSQSYFKNFGSAVNNKMAELLLGKPKGIKFSSFCIINKFLANEIKKYNGPFPYPGGMILQVTSKIGQVEIEHRKRMHGKSNYTLAKLLNLWLNGFTGFSIVPLRLASVLGFIFCQFSMAFILFLVIRKIFYPSSIIAGWTSVIVISMFSYGVIMMFLGLLGEYIGRLLLFVNRKPQFIIRETVNIEENIDNNSGN